LEAKIAGGGPAAQLAEWHRLVLSNRIDAVVTALPRAGGAGLLASVRVWLELLDGRRPADLREEPYVPAPAL